MSLPADLDKHGPGGGLRGKMFNFDLDLAVGAKGVLRDDLQDVAFGVCEDLLDALGFLYVS